MVRLEIDGLTATVAADARWVSDEPQLARLLDAVTQHVLPPEGLSPAEGRGDIAIALAVARALRREGRRVRVAAIDPPLEAMPDRIY